MLAQFRQWRTNIPIADPLQRELAVVLQSFLFILLAAALVGAPASLMAAAPAERIAGVSSSLLVGLVLLAAVLVLRRGAFRAAVVLVILAMLALAALNMVPTGLEGSRAIFTLLATPIFLAGLLGGRRMLALALLLSVLLVVSIAVLGSAAPALVGYSQQTYDPLLTCVAFLIMASALGLLVDRFGHALHTTLARAHSREQELDALRVSLEQQVAERTAVLQSTVDQLHASQATINELGAPILPVLPGVLVAPLIGTIDSARAARLAEKILAAVSQQRAHTVIFDITGVALVDTYTAQLLVHMASATRLLGAEATIVGVRPGVAQTMVALNIDLRGYKTYPNLQEAVEALMA